MIPRPCAAVFGGLLGSRFSTAMEDRVCHSYDATNVSFLPDAVAYPKSPEEIAEIMKAANAYRVPVVPRGAGAGFSGGAVPVAGGLSLVITGMNRILSVDRDNMVAHVEAGVVTADLQRAAEAAGLFYPPDPASQEFSTIGGNIAECAGGMRAVKYGVTREYVRRLEAVLPSGEIIVTGAVTAKSVVGYDLTRLLVGSEGTLAIITRAVLRLVPLPKAVRTLQARFGRLDGAVKAVTSIMASGIIPRTLELLDRSALRAVAQARSLEPENDWGGVLIIETDGSPDSAAREIDEIGTLLSAFANCQVVMARSETEREELWDVRRAVSSAINRLGKRKLNEDVAVPISRIPELIERVRSIETSWEIPIVCFGHAGDGNIHVNLMYDPDADGIKERLESALDELLRATLDLGGTLSGEHGIGMAKSKFLTREVSPPSMEIMKGIKRVFDPNNILNPHKIFPQATE